MYFRSFYRCPDCSHEWMDDCSDRISDDDCPQCGAVAISSIDTEEISPDVEEERWEIAGYPRKPAEIPAIGYDHFSRVAAAVLPPMPSNMPVATACRAQQVARSRTHLEPPPVAGPETFNGDRSAQLDMFDEQNRHPSKK